MKLLLIGNGSSVTDVALGLRAAEVPLRIRSRLSSGLTLLREAPEAFSLVLVERNEEEDDCLKRRVLETGTLASVVLLGRPAVTEMVHAGTSEQRPPVCGLESTRDGTRRLRCALAQARACPDEHPSLAEAIEEKPLVLAYSAPCGARR